MHKMWPAAAIVAALLPVPATAQDLREFCGDRPGLSTPACTVDPGHLQVELGLGDWTLDKQPDSRTDTVLAGDLQLRYGIGDTTELRLGWTALGHERVRDRMTGTIEHATRTGDVTVGIKQNLHNPDGKGFSIAVLPFASLPVGRQPIGAGTWGVGVLVPIEYELTDGLQLQLTPEIDAKPDEDGNGRHLAYSNVVGLDVGLTKSLELDLELQAIRDREPEGHQTMALAGVALDYVVAERTQFDIGSTAALNRNTPDVEVYFGISRKF